MSEERASAPPPIGLVLVFVLAVFFYIGMMASLADISSSDAAGRGLDEAFAALFGLVLWLLLGVMLLIGGVRGAMPDGAAVAAAVLLPASAVASVIAAGMLRTRLGWPLLVPGLVPPLIAFYAFWARLPILQRALRPLPTSLAAWSAVLLIALTPLPDYVAGKIAAARLRAEEAAAAAVRDAAEAAKRAEARARFEKLGDASPLWEWAAFFGEHSEFDKAAIAGARALDHRQTDSEEALRRGLGFPLVEYGRLDLAATPAFCTAAAEFLRADAAAHPSPGGDAYAAYDVIHANFSPYLEAIEWLTQVGCDLDDAVARLAETAAAYPQSSSRDAFLGVLAWRRGNGFYKRDTGDRALAAYDEALRYLPDNEQFFASRGNVYYDRRDYDRAIADYGEAIRLNKFYSAAWDSRANAYHQQGDDDRALADYDEAIRLAPDFALAFNNRGALYAARGEPARAIEDFDQAITLAPRFRIALFNRGRSKLYADDAAGAVADLAAAAALKPNEPYPPLWLYLARTRAGDPDAAAGLRRDSAKLDAGWPRPIVAALLGESDTAAVFAAAQTGDPEARQGQECEAGFYLGVKAATGGDAATARDLLTRAAALCPRSFIETPAIRLELARLR